MIPLTQGQDVIVDDGDCFKAIEYNRCLYKGKTKDYARTDVSKKYDKDYAYKENHA